MCAICAYASTAPEPFPAPERIAGVPERGISTETAAGHYAAGEIVWTLGDEITILHGGIARATDKRSVLAVPPIIDQMDFLAPKLPKHRRARGID